VRDDDAEQPLLRHPVLASKWALSFYFAVLIVQAIYQRGAVDEQFIFLAVVAGAFALIAATNWIRASIDNKATAALQGIAELLLTATLIIFAAVTIYEDMPKYPQEWAALTHSKTITELLQNVLFYQERLIIESGLLLMLLLVAIRVFSNAFGRPSKE
jgi:apolipoprotein N-acyltransferase